MNASGSTTIANPVSPWEVPDVKGGLEFTGKLLTNVLTLSTQSKNHSLKAQHLLSRGIEILVSVQLYLNNPGEGLLKTLETLNELGETEKVLTESIEILEDDVKQPDLYPCHQAVMSSWHLNRNAFTAKLEGLSKTGDDRWTTVMKDVVRADDLTFATRLSEDVKKNGNDAANEAVQNLVELLEDEKTGGDENTRTDSILGIMCLADESKRKKGTDLGNVVMVVNDMAKKLKQPDAVEEGWRSISDRLHELPVCRKVEKPLLLHQGAYTISDIIKDAQAEVLSAGGFIGDLVPLETEDSTGAKFVEGAKKYVTQINDAMVEAKRNLVNLSKKKSFNDAKGKTENQILYAATRLLGDTAFALAPVLALSAFTGEVNNVTDSVSGFVKALTEFNGVQDKKWKETLSRTLDNTAKRLQAFGGVRTIEGKGPDGGVAPVEGDANPSIQTAADKTKDGTLTGQGNSNGQGETIENAVVVGNARNAAGAGDKGNAEGAGDAGDAGDAGGAGDQGNAGGAGGN